MALREFEYEEHTADIKITAYGNTLKRAIEALFLGILNIIYDLDSVEPKEQKEIESEGEDTLVIIFDLGTKILDTVYVDKFLIRDVRVKNLRRVRKENGQKVWYARAGIFGEKFDKSKHKLKKEVKAITYNEIEVKRLRKSLWTVSLVVDV